MTTELHVVTDDSVLGHRNFLENAAGVLTSGVVKAFHLRGPGTSLRRLLELSEVLLPMARANRTSLFINDRVDLALICQADGVHLGTRSLPFEKVRQILGSKPNIGRSVHSVQEGVDLALEGVDYLFLGSIFETKSHPEDTPLGLRPLRKLSALVQVPVIAIGGVTPTRVPTLLEAGATGVAVLGDIWGSPSPAHAVLSYQ